MRFQCVNNWDEAKIMGFLVFQVFFIRIIIFIFKFQVRKKIDFKRFVMLFKSNESFYAINIDDKGQNGFEWFKGHFKMLFPSQNTAFLGIRASSHHTNTLLLIYIHTSPLTFFFVIITSEIYSRFHILQYFENIIILRFLTIYKNYYIRNLNIPALYTQTLPQMHMHIVN